MEHDWLVCFVLVLDILNWIFMLVSWICLCAALSTPVNALNYCKYSRINQIIDTAPNPSQNLISYLKGLQSACNYTYAGIAFGICAWYPQPLPLPSSRLVFFSLLFLLSTD